MSAEAQLKYPHRLHWSVYYACAIAICDSFNNTLQIRNRKHTSKIFSIDLGTALDVVEAAMTLHQ